MLGPSRDIPSLRSAQIPTRLPSISPWSVLLCYAPCLSRNATSLHPTSRLTQHRPDKRHLVDCFGSSGRHGGSPRQGRLSRQPVLYPSADGVNGADKGETEDQGSDATTRHHADKLARRARASHATLSRNAASSATPRQDRRQPHSTSPSLQQLSSTDLLAVLVCFVPIHGCVTETSCGSIGGIVIARTPRHYVPSTDE